MINAVTAELVEVVARTIAGVAANRMVRHAAFNGTYEGYVNSNWEVFKDETHAALQAINEAGFAVVKKDHMSCQFCGNKFQYKYGYGGVCSRCGCKFPATKDEFDAMFQASQKETE